jgi:hypothetical protein
MNSKLLAVHVLRTYAWEALESNNVLSRIKGKVPIIPIEDEPNISDEGKAYIVYGFSESINGKLWQEVSGQMIFRVTSPTFAEFGHILNIVSRTFEDSDLAVPSINEWSTNYPDGVLHGIRFTRTELSFIESPDAPDEEGGNINGIVNIGYSYVTHQVIKRYKGGQWI